MQKKDAYKILGLKERASRIEVEKRYSILLRKVRAGTKEEASDIDFNEMTDAYNLLMGYVIEEDNTNKIPKKTNPILKKLGIDQGKLTNNLYYFRTHIIVGIILLLTVIFSVRSCVNRVIPDLNLVFMGDIYCSDADKLQEDLKANISGVNAVGIENLLMSGSQEKQDPQVQIAMMQKAMILVAAGDIDVFIVDKVNFDRYVVQGGFMKLDDFAAQFNVPEEKQYKSRIEEEDKKDYIYGFNVLDSKILKDATVTGKQMIAVISVKVKNYDYAVKFIELLLKK